MATTKSHTPLRPGPRICKLSYPLLNADPSYARIDRLLLPGECCFVIQPVLWRRLFGRCLPLLCNALLFCFCQRRKLLLLRRPLLPGNSRHGTIKARLRTPTAFPKGRGILFRSRSRNNRRVPAPVRTGLRLRSAQPTIIRLVEAQ